MWYLKSLLPPYSFHPTESSGLDVIATKDGAFVRGRTDSWNAYDLQQFAVGMNELQESLKKSGSTAEILYISAQPQINAEYTEPFRCRMSRA